MTIGDCQFKDSQAAEEVIGEISASFSILLVIAQTIMNCTHRSVINIIMKMSMKMPTSIITWRWLAMECSGTETAG